MMPKGPPPNTVFLLRSVGEGPVNQRSLKQSCLINYDSFNGPIWGKISQIQKHGKKMRRMWPQESGKEKQKELVNIPPKNN